MAAFEGYDWIRRLPYTNALFVAKICTKLHGRIVKTKATQRCYVERGVLKRGSKFTGE